MIPRGNSGGGEEDSGALCAEAEVPLLVTSSGAAAHT